MLLMINYGSNCGFNDASSLTVNVITVQSIAALMIGVRASIELLHSLIGLHQTNLFHFHAVFGNNRLGPHLWGCRPVWKILVLQCRPFVVIGIGRLEYGHDNNINVPNKFGKFAQI